MGTHKIPPDCEVVPPMNGLLSTSITVNPCTCPAMAAAHPPAPDPMQIQSTVEDHVLACIRLPSQRNRAVDRRPTAWHSVGLNCPRPCHTCPFTASHRPYPLRSVPRRRAHHPPMAR